jgi:parallel beta-helix repeat protein
VPTASDKVQIQHAVTYDASDGQAATIGITATGVLTFDTTRTTRLTVETVLILPHGQMVCLPGSGTTVIVFRDTPLDLTHDPFQYSHGLLVVDGTLTLHGAHLTPFVRLSTEPRVGDSTLTLVQPPQGWDPGDQLVVPDSRHLRSEQRGRAYRSQIEERTVAAMAGAVVRLTAPLAYLHPGARDARGHLDFTPHVANLTRSITLQSANPQGTRGHVLIMGNANVDLEFVAFDGLGRTTTARLDSTTVNPDGSVRHLGTNQIGRYAMHFHHMRQPVTFVGNVVAHTTKWGITLHDTHYSTLTDNVIYDTWGTGIMLEEGNESYNAIQRNLVLLSQGPGGRGDERAPTEYGYEGSCYWLHGVNNVVDDNVCANALSNFGVFIFNSGNGMNAAHVPMAPGVDTSAPGGYVLTDMMNLAPLSFANNEIYASQGGMSVWSLGARGTSGPAIRTNAPRSVLTNTRVWHVWSYAWYGYGMSNVTLDGWTVRGDAAAITKTTGGPAVGLHWGDYVVRGMQVLHADIQGEDTGIVAPMKVGDTVDAYGTQAGELLVQDSLISATVCYRAGTMSALLGGSHIPARRLTLANVRCVNPPGVTAIPILMSYRTDGPHSNLLQKDEVIVTSYQQQPGVDFRVYYLQQAPTFVVPPTGGPIAIGAPRAGLTNAQLWAQYGVALAGAVAPCADTKTHPEIQGITCR